MTGSFTIPQHRRRTALITALVFLVVFAVFVGTPIGQRFDNAAKLFGATHELARRLRRDGLPTLKHLSTIMAAASVFAVIVVISLWHGRRLLRSVGGVLLIAVPPVVIAELLKDFVDRPRLLVVPDYLRIATFPSGHVAVVAGCALAAFVAAPLQRRGAVAVLGGAVVATQVVLVVAGARHRPSDAVGAVLLTLLWGLVGGVAPDSVQPPAVRAPQRLGLVIAVGSIVGVIAALAVAPSDVVASRAASSRCMAVAVVWALLAGLEFARCLLEPLATARMVTDPEPATTVLYPRRNRA